MGTVREVVAASHGVYDRAPMRWFIDVIYLAAGVLCLPVLAYRMVVHGKNRRGWRERLGSLPFEPERPRIWLHGVSVGEINAATKLVHALESRFDGMEVVVSSTTDTGMARARQHFGADRVFRFPLDFGAAVRRAIDRLNPQVVVLVELEIWPNLVALAWGRRIPVVVVNGRLTERSAKRFSYLGPLTSRMFTRLSWVGAQDDTIADRFIRAGVPGDRVAVTGSLKWDTAEVADDVPGAGEMCAALGLCRDRPVWVCGSTGPGEERVILDAYRRVLGTDERVQLVVVPRKPERFNEVARLIVREGFSCVRRTACPDSAGPGAAPRERAVFLGDTMGELRKLYASADVVFVGRSLVPLGGSDPMEVAALGKPILCGPHMDNFREPTELLASDGGLREVSDAEALAVRVGELCADHDLARVMGGAARQVVLRQQGATAKTVEAIARVLGTSGSLARVG